MEFYELLAIFTRTKSARETMLTYEKYYDECVKHNLHIISSDMNTYLNMPILKNIMKFENIKTIFEHPNLSFLSPKIMKEMSNGGEAPLAIDTSVSFESNTARYLHDYMEYGVEKVPQKFIETLTFLLDNNINLDPMLYILENVSKGEDSPEFYKNLISIKKLMTCDMEYYNKTKSDSKSIGKIKSIYDDERVIKDSRAEVEFLKTDGKDMLEIMRQKHLMMKTILLLIINARFKYKDNMKLQFEYIVKFMNCKTKKIFLREFSVAIYYFERKNIEFFKKIKNKDSFDKFLKAIDNMAWDFTIIRFLEMNFSSKINPKADFFIPFIFTLDKGLIESIEMFYCKDFLIFHNEKRADPIPYTSIMSKIKKYKLDEYFTKESFLNRLNSDEVDFQEIYNELEAEVKKVCKLI